MNSECPSGSQCELGFCASTGEPAANGGRGGRRATSTSNSETPGDEGGSGAQTGTTTNPAMMSQSGAGGSRMSTPSMPSGRDAGTAMTMPMTTTPPVATGDCKSTDAPRSCPIAAGCEGTQRCVGTSWGGCEAPADRMNKPEMCNGIDDNCNGMVDEIPPQPCYPAGTSGCTSAADGTFACKGLCHAGKQECVNGELAKCVGDVTPQPKDDCQAAGVPALDEDCNGAADDKCQCTEEKVCYTGGGTQGVGECRPGKLTCVNNQLGTQCVGEVRDSIETCNGKDDDCNGMTDDVFGVGIKCAVAGAKGVCATGIAKCVSGSATPVCVADKAASAEVCNGLDDDCNDILDDVPGLQTNAAMCGGCGKPACTAAASSCCAGGCADLQTDVKNCGMCGKPCPGVETCSAGVCKAPPLMGGAGASGAGTSGGAGAGGTGGRAGASGASD